MAKWGRGVSQKIESAESRGLRYNYKIDFWDTPKRQNELTEEGVDESRGKPMC